MPDGPELPDVASAVERRFREEIERFATTLGLRTRVLVIDDDVDSAYLISRYLERRGHPVCVVHDAPEALDAAARFAPDVIVLDVGLPSGDGCDLAPMLRAGSHNGLRIVGLSGYDDRQHRERADAAGFDAYLVKPTSLKAVAGEVEGPD